jgi:hypothetical protein
MNYEFLARVTMDAVTSKSRVDCLTSISEVIIDANKRPHFYLGDNWYNNMLITSTEVADRKIDDLLRGAYNAWQIAETLSEDFTQQFTIGNDEDGNGQWDITIQFEKLYEDTDKLLRVSYSDGTVKFYMADDEATEWSIIEIY